MAGFGWESGAALQTLLEERRDTKDKRRLGQLFYGHRELTNDEK